MNHPLASLTAHQPIDQRAHINQSSPDRFNLFMHEPTNIRSNYNSNNIPSTHLHQTTTTSTQHHPSQSSHHPQQQGPNRSHNNNGRNIFLRHNSCRNRLNDDIEGDTSSDDYKFRYHYNLLLFMRRPEQYKPIAFDAKISAIIITIWCILNMFVYGATDWIFNNLLLFLITILIIHKDLILCNGQSCLPLLLLFNFTVRMVIEFIINIDIISFDGGNICLILIILLFSCQRFIFNIFTPNYNGYDIHWNLIRCHLFYRGNNIRWISFLIYCWFTSLMILQLMDAVCIGNVQYADFKPFELNMSSNGHLNGNLNHKLCGIKRIRFITCDTVIVIYCIMVLSVWNRLKYVDLKYFHYNLNVKGYGIREIFIFIGVFLITFVLSETWFSQKIILPFTVVIVLIINFLMR